MDQGTDIVTTIFSCSRCMDRSSFSTGSTFGASHLKFSRQYGEDVVTGRNSVGSAESPKFDEARSGSALSPSSSMVDRLNQELDTVRRAWKEEGADLRAKMVRHCGNASINLCCWLHSFA
jgi:hypothetical protein